MDVNKRQPSAKIELQHRVKDESTEDDKENVHRHSSRRMDVMDLIKLASAEDLERKKSAVEENNCLLDCGDRSATDTLAVIDVQTSDDVFPANVRYRTSTLTPEQGGACAHSQQHDAHHSNVSCVLPSKGCTQYSGMFPATNVRIKT
ncbi:unnamed protein product [Strongylus vulgaris]|uniref:Uncharacterized protein n=1 Tax=Strongylus vulgaris TaxID=40348 RepID=A0A3P7LHT0_STRVU|nr:unnamed protein product [Strongylus vulgaris]